MPLAGLPIPILDSLRSLRCGAGVAYGGGRRWIAASQSKGRDDANGEPETRGRLRVVNGVGGILTGPAERWQARCHKLKVTVCDTVGQIPQPCSEKGKRPHSPFGVMARTYFKQCD